MVTQYMKSLSEVFSEENVIFNHQFRVNLEPSLCKASHLEGQAGDRMICQTVQYKLLSNIYMYKQVLLFLSSKLNK